MQRHAFALAFTALALGALATGCPFSAETFHKHCAVAKDCDDGVECTENKCTAGLCENPPKTKETACGPTKASVCDGKGECVECLSNADCMANHAMKPICDTELVKCVSCFDGVQNGKETDVDCGGPDCGACLGEPCDPVHMCGNNTICATQDGICCKTACGQTCEACVMTKTGQPDGTCAPIPYGQDPDGECTTGGGCGATANLCRCQDGVKNGDESDADCGGPTCQKCEGGKTCSTEMDCAIDVFNCVNHACCNDKCNFPCKACNSVGQCTSVPGGTPDPFCTNGTVCSSGGGSCVATAGISCNVGGDCLSKRCIAGKCDKSNNGEPCSTTADCLSGTCQSFVCF